MKGKALAPIAATVALLAAPTGGGQPTKAWEQAPRVVIVTPAATASSTTQDRAIPIISLSVKDADLVEVVRSFARIAGINVILDPGVSGTVTAELVNVRWDHALAVILKTQGLAMELDGRILTVARPQRLIGAQ